MYIVRHQIPQMPVKKVEKGGRAKLEAIKELGVEINKEEARGLSRGLGAGGKVRFEILEAVEEGKETLKIRVAKSKK